MVPHVCKFTGLCICVSPLGVLQLEYLSLPQPETEANQLHDLLSQHLESCMLVPTTQGVECRVCNGLSDSVEGCMMMGCEIM